MPFAGRFDGHLISGAIRSPSLVITSVLTVDLITIFPEFFVGPVSHGIVQQAQKKGILTIEMHDLRDFTTDKHRTVDDRPFGGGEGMVLKPEPLFRALRKIYPRGASSEGQRVVMLTPQGRPLTQQISMDFSRCQRLSLLCGRYEGMDERVCQHWVTDEISIGDYILSGGELAACVLMECVVRLLPGALNNSSSTTNESFRVLQNGHDQDYALLDCPQYTRPEEFEGMKVPGVLMSGHHQKVYSWRRKKSIEKTLKNRPDLLKWEGLSDEDRRLLSVDFE
jgi:tRNA (guanine37-N1)-methyltransferase